MTTPTSGSRRERPAKPALSRSAIVAAARTLLAEEPLDRVTMRRIATALDTGAASLYVYVRNTEELHAAVLDELLAEVPVPADDTPDDGTPDDGTPGQWRERLLELLVAYTELLFRHPSLARMAITTRPSGPHSLRLVDALLGLLAHGGVPARQAAWGVDLLVQHATATAAEAGTREEAPGAEAEEAAFFASVRAAAAPDSGYRHLTAAGEDLVSGTGEQRLRWAFDVLLNGLLATPTPEPEPGPAA